MRTIQGRGHALPTTSRPLTPPPPSLDSTRTQFVRPQPRAPSPRRSPSVRALVKTAGLAALTLGGAVLPNPTTQRVPSLDLGANATPITPLVDTAPLPRDGEEPHYSREYVLPVPHDFEWPRVDHFAFYDHTGNFPRAWSEIGWPGISVADRRSSQQPPNDWIHIVGRVQDFLQVYPYPIGIQTNNVTCAFSNLASATTWREKICSGDLLQSAREFVWINHIGARSAGEQPPSALEFLVGVPSFETDAIDHFAARQKTWCWWTRGLPSVPNGRRTPEHLQLPRRSSAVAETRMLVRTETELQFARDHVAAWNVTPWLLDLVAARALA